MAGQKTHSIKNFMAKARRLRERKKKQKKIAGSFKKRKLRLT